MVKPQQLQKKALSQSTPINQPAAYLQTRPFALKNLEETSQNEQTAPDIQPQVQHNQSFHHNFGNTRVQPVTKTIVQPKLTIGKPGDKYEQEADKVAEEVVKRIHSPKVFTSAPGQPVQRREAPEEDELQMKPIIQRQADASGMDVSAGLESAINRVRGGGQSLASSIRQPMEQAFGADFSKVKVHTDGQSDQLNRSIQAKAFATGQDIFFRQGAYSPESRSGQELLAHELTHVVQQNGTQIRRKQVEHETSIIKDEQFQYSGLTIQRNNTSTNTPTQIPIQSVNPSSPSITNPYYVVTGKTALYERTTSNKFFGGTQESLKEKEQAEVGDILQTINDTEVKYAGKTLYIEMKDLNKGAKGITASVIKEKAKVLDSLPKIIPSPAETMIIKSDAAFYLGKPRHKNIALGKKADNIRRNTKVLVDKEAIGVNNSGEDSHYYVKHGDKEGYIETSALAQSSGLTVGDTTAAVGLDDQHYVPGFIRTTGNVYQQTPKSFKKINSVEPGTLIMVNYQAYISKEGENYVGIKIVKNDGSDSEPGYIQEYKVTSTSQKQEASVEEDTETLLDKILEGGIGVLEGGKTPLEEAADGIEAGKLKEKQNGRMQDVESQKGGEIERSKNTMDAIAGGADVVVGIFGFVQSIKKFGSESGSWDKAFAALEAASSIGTTGAGITKVVDSSLKLKDSKGEGDKGWDLAGKVGGAIADGINSVKDAAISLIGLIRMDKNSTEKLKTGSKLGVQLLQSVQSGLKCAKGFFDAFDNAGIPTGLFDAVPGVGIAINAAKAIISFGTAYIAGKQKGEMQKSEMAAQEQLYDVIKLTLPVDEHGNPWVYSSQFNPDDWMEDEKRGAYGLRKTYRRINPYILKQLESFDGKSIIIQLSGELRVKLNKEHVDAIKHYELASKLHEINQKRQVNNNISGSLDLVNMAGDIANVTGVGAFVGGIIKGALASGKLLYAGGRFIQQYYRDKAHAGIEQAKTSATNLQDFRGKKVDADKSRAHKEKEYLNHAKFIFTMVGQLPNAASMSSAMPKEDRAKMVQKYRQTENYIKATGVDVGLLYSKNGKPNEQLQMILKALRER